MTESTEEQAVSFELGQRISPGASRILRALPGADTGGDSSKDAPFVDLVEGTIPDHRVYQAESFHRQFQARTAERRAKLESLYSELGRPDSIIIMMFCKSFVPMFENWLISCEMHGIAPLGRLIVFCLDDHAAERAAELGAKYYFLDPEYYAPAGKSEHFGDEWFRSTILYKNAVILEALSLGASVLFQDADLIWFKDPFPYLEESRQHYDLQIMYDGPNPNGRPVYGNTGFMYLRPGAVTDALMETALYNSASILREGQQQFIFMRLLRYFLANKLISVHILPEHLFLNGHLFNLETGVQPAALRWKEEGIVLHYSWTGSRAEKLRKLDKLELNYAGLSADSGSESLGVATPPEVGRPAPVPEQPAPAGDATTFHAVTLHLVDRDTITLTCDGQSAVLKTILGAFFRPDGKGKRNATVHLQLLDDMQCRDVFLRPDQISRIEIIPPLSEVVLLRIAYADLTGFRISLMKGRSLITRARRRLLQLKKGLKRCEP